MTRRLEVFWDVSSPYTYLATTQTDALAARAGAEIVYRPFLLGGVFKATGNAMPAAVASRAKYLLVDLDRWRKRYGVPMKLPSEGVPFPINSVKAMRAAVAADRRGQQESLRKALMRAYWEEARDVSNEEVLATVIGQAGLDAAGILADAASQEVKDALRAASDEAVERGAFGAPSLFVGDEMFFGNDRLDFVEAALEDA